MAVFDDNNEIEIEILKSKIVGLEAEVINLRDKLRIQSKNFTKSIELLAKMEFLLQLRHQISSPKPMISLVDGQPSADIIIETPNETTSNSDITDQQIDEAIDKEIYEESEETSDNIEELFFDEDFIGREVKADPDEKPEENTDIELVEVVTLNADESLSTSVSKNIPSKPNKRKQSRGIRHERKKKKTNRATAVYSRVDGLYRCPFTDICNYTSKDSSNFLKHIRIHTGERKYSCAYCDKTFTDWNTRLSHELRHPESGAQECPKCNRRFVPTKLEDHMINCKLSKSKKKAGETKNNLNSNEIRKSRFRIR